MEFYNVPGISIAKVSKNKLEWSKAYGTANTRTGKKVDTSTLFQAGSISKPVTALGALKLVENNKLDLDEDVNKYLKSWKIPENKYTSKEKVSLRMLLTHTAGTNVSGFPGYKRRDSLPTTAMILNGKGDTPKLIVDTLPGSNWSYSGGGYTVIQQLIEDVSGLPFEEYMQKEILAPLGMENSSFEQPLPEKTENFSAAYDLQGKIIDSLYHNYPEKAAAGLWTTPTDLAKYCMEIQKILSGKKYGVISKSMAGQMLTKHQFSWGLGPRLQGEKDSLIFAHGGKNAGFTNNLLAFANKGEALIIMTNGDNGIRLFQEIQRSVSEVYNWNLDKPRIVRATELKPEFLSKLEGTYKYSGQTPDEYLVKVVYTDGKLNVYDLQDNDSLVLTPLNTNNYVDVLKGDEIVFSNPEKATISFKWNNSQDFFRIEKAKSK
ncbi:serine hydrolase domain-containing protein [Salegentibacter chungangensis]|uniref:Serine hydrolase domain-containing protein n=1 Tax=Salegentibacter chungangensis TaxID=1335724 RepID=A0ABW3NV51_9FLAO